MKSIIKKLICIFTVLALCISLSACSTKSKQEQLSLKTNSEVDKSDEKKEIQIGCFSSFEIIIDWIQEGLEPLGYEVEAVIFDSNNLPATALKNGDIDGLIHNHLPWIEIFNKENDSNLKMPKPYMAYGREGLYSSKYKTVEDIPENAKIAMPSDPTNMEKSLLLLEEIGFITLGEKTEEFYTILDIKDNPKNIDIIESEISTVVRNIHDVDAVICTATNILKAGMDPNDILYEDMSKINFPFGLVVNEEDLDTEWVENIMNVTQSDEFRDKFNKHFKGTLALYE